MCKWLKSGNTRIDSCLRTTLLELQKQDIVVLASCCGHGIYKKTVIARFPDKEPYEFFSKTKIPRKRRFYKRDCNGVFFIPEVEVTS